jgi:NMD protein affecting ribosome stability and mRNA decay
MKRCTGCKIEWPEAAFWHDKSRPDGLHQYCRNCHSVRMSGYWKTVYYPRRRTELIAINNARQKMKRVLAADAMASD